METKPFFLKALIHRHWTGSAFYNLTASGGDLLTGIEAKKIISKV